MRRPGLPAKSSPPTTAVSLPSGVHATEQSWTPSHDAVSSGRVTYTPGAEGGYVEVVGVVDMVLEVVSDSSEKKDNQTLFEAYFEAGIAEYWLVDARGETVQRGLGRVEELQNPEASPAAKPHWEKVKSRLSETDMGLKRIRELVVKLRTFSRIDGGERGVANLNECVDSVLTILGDESSSLT